MKDVADWHYEMFWPDFLVASEFVMPKRGSSPPGAEDSGRTFTCELKIQQERLSATHHVAKGIVLCVSAEKTRKTNDRGQSAHHTNCDNVMK